MQIIDKNKKTVLSGIQPTGRLHIGNYIGALSVWVENQEKFNNLFCIADLHALTIPEVIKADYLHNKTREVAALYIASGIDPEKSPIFLQSAVGAHPYLGWILGCCTPIGWLERMTQYKSKAAAQESVGTGLLTYPTLQAADILLYRPDYVPVGEDQKQHVELTRDIAQRFNTLFGEYFKLPDPLIRASGARIMGLDAPDTKMSKSIGEKKKGHAIGLLDDADTIRKTVMSAVTDSGNEFRFEHASPGTKNLLVLFEVLSRQDRQSMENYFSGKGYGHLKRELSELIIATLEPVQRKYNEIMREPAHIEEILHKGAVQAAEIADRTLSDVRKLTGID
jgi:tryptophanyl-tRNA synthetase